MRKCSHPGTCSYRQFSFSWHRILVPTWTLFQTGTCNLLNAKGQSPYCGLVRGQHVKQQQQLVHLTSQITE